MEIEDTHNGTAKVGKTSLRLRVVKMSRINHSIYELIAREVNVEHDKISKSSDINANGEVVSAKNDADDKLIKVIVEGLWTQAHIVENSLIHLVQAQYDTKTSTYKVDNSSGLLVLEPDNLLTCTAVASSLFCERKTWLNNVFLGQVGTNRAMLVGTLVHEVFQYGVKNKIVDQDKLIKFLDEELDDATVMLETYSVELHIKDIRNEAISYIKSVKEWIEKFMLTGPRYPLTNDENLEVKIIGVSDIEENVWSTKYGLKGKIDVTGAVRVYDKQTKKLEDKTLPLELKTGNPNLSSSHQAQVSLYSMMIEDRYAETNQGFVIYLKDKAAMHNVSLNHNIKRDLVQRRNQLNYHMKSYFFGPEMIDQQRTCRNCERLTECILMSNMYEHDIDRFATMKSLEMEATGHLDSKFILFFTKYHEKLAALMSRGEQSSGVSGTGDKLTSATATSGSFWTYSSSEAEIRGTGFGKLQASIVGETKTNLIRFKRHPNYKENILTDEVDIESSNGGGNSQPSAKRQRIEDYFKPKKLDQTKYKPFNTELNFSRYRIAISQDDDGTCMDSQNSSTAIAIGFMQELKEDQFVLKVYEGALDCLLKSESMFRVDRIEKRTNLDIERMVLIRLLAREDWRCDRVRQLLLDPKYAPTENIDLNLFVVNAAFEEVAELESGHQRLVVDAISTNNYYIFNEQLIHSRLQAHRIGSVLTRIICQLDRTVLIVAQNIDHLMDLMRLLQKNKTRFILIDDGKSTKARFQYASNLVKVPQSGEGMDLVRKYDSYIRQHEKAPVVITSYAMSIGGLLFTRRTFDYCIAYDCDTTELLVGLSPMFCSDRHLLLDIRGIAASEMENKKNTDDITIGDHLRSLRPTTNSTTTTTQQQQQQVNNSKPTVETIEILS